jgi:hypothetical protein
MMSIPEINLKVISKTVRGRSRTLQSDKWVDLEAHQRMKKIFTILNKIK